jgi:hypothetical protein
MPSKKIEEAFAATARVLLGEPTPGLDACANWLKREIPPWKEVKTKSGLALVPGYAVFPKISDGKLALLADLDGASRIVFKKDECELRSISAWMKEEGRFSTDLVEGTNQNVEKCAIYKDLNEAYMCLDCFYSKYVAFNWFCDRNDHIFGCQLAFYSSHCIKCCHSSHLSRCFECDSCTKCADCYFCHNCEGLQDCMFCFNVNNLRYAVANVVVGKEKYEKLKQALLLRASSELREKAACTLSIYNF